MKEQPLPPALGSQLFCGDHSFTCSPIDKGFWEGPGEDWREALRCDGAACCRLVLQSHMQELCFPSSPRWCPHSGISDPWGIPTCLRAWPPQGFTPFRPACVPGQCLLCQRAKATSGTNH